VANDVVSFIFDLDLAPPYGWSRASGGSTMALRLRSNGFSETMKDFLLWIVFWEKNISSYFLVAKRREFRSYSMKRSREEEPEELLPKLILRRIIKENHGYG